MRINLIAIGTKMPAWVETGFREYQQRLMKPWSLQLIEIATQKRLKTTDLAKLKQWEGEQLLKAVPKGDFIIALHASKTAMTTETLAQKFSAWEQHAQPLSFLIGGPEGLSEQVLEQADEQLALSALTFPHPLVRIILAEQIYRVWSVYQNTPYHR